jgi:hypothetical protein
VSVLLAAAVAAMLALSASTASARAAAAGSGGGGQCAVDESGVWVTVQCADSGSSGGSGGGAHDGSGGKGSPSQQTTICRFAQLDKQEAAQLGLFWPPPKGAFWALMDCTGGKQVAGPLAVLVHTGTNAPEVTPQQLLAQALGELQIPVTKPGLAPPLGRDGLVGLPEWYWIAASGWHPESVTVRAGPVWATARAAPAGLAFEPGGGLAGTSCAGPGTAYRPAEPASAQHTSCSYTYQQPSAGQPGGAYQAAVIVTWQITWTGSGGVGGVVNPGLRVPYQFALPIAQGEALVTSP